MRSPPTGLALDAAANLTSILYELAYIAAACRQQLLPSTHSRISLHLVRKNDRNVELLGDLLQASKELVEFLV